MLFRSLLAFLLVRIVGGWTEPARLQDAEQKHAADGEPDLGKVSPGGMAPNSDSAARPVAESWTHRTRSSGHPLMRIDASPFARMLQTFRLERQCCAGAAICPRRGAGFQPAASASRIRCISSRFRDSSARAFERAGHALDLNAEAGGAAYVAKFAAMAGTDVARYARERPGMSCGRLENRVAG